jgi:hypothetical protein
MYWHFSDLSESEQHLDDPKSPLQPFSKSVRQFLQAQGKLKEYVGVRVALALVVTMACRVATSSETKEVNY